MRIMSAFQKLDPIRHRVSIAGKVLDAVSQSPLRGVEVRLTVMPEAYRARLAQAPDHVLTTGDGTFRFIDLPKGNYTLTAQLPGAGSRYGVVFRQLVLPDPVGAPLVVSDFTLPPTGLQGVISALVPDSDPQGPAPAASAKGAAASPKGAGVSAQATAAPATVPVVMAQVVVLGSGEKAFTDADGKYMLSGLEQGARTVRVTTQAYPPADQQVVLQQGQMQRVDVLVSPLKQSGAQPTSAKQ
jgi:hypothetical protein